MMRRRRRRVAGCGRRRAHRRRLGEEGENKAEKWSNSENKRDHGSQAQATLGLMNICGNRPYPDQPPVNLRQKMHKRYTHADCCGLTLSRDSVHHERRECRKEMSWIKRNMNAEAEETEIIQIEETSGKVLQVVSCPDQLALSFSSKSISRAQEKDILRDRNR